jgi:hypothetical protein
MADRIPITKVTDLDRLDTDEVVEGYRDGFANERCGDNRSQSYWHGWRNGMTDGGHAPKTAEQAALCRDFLAKEPSDG